MPAPASGARLRSAPAHDDLRVASRAKHASGVNLDHTDRCLPYPLFDLEQFWFERESLHRDPVPGKLTANSGGGRMIGGQQRRADRRHEHRRPQRADRCRASTSAWRTPPTGQADWHINSDDSQWPAGLRLDDERLDVAGEVSTHDSIVDGYRDPATPTRIDTQHPSNSHKATMARTATGRHTNAPPDSPLFWLTTGASLTAGQTCILSEAIRQCRMSRIRRIARVNQPRDISIGPPCRCAGYVGGKPAT
jgi:hypothetical protein